MYLIKIILVPDGQVVVDEDCGLLKSQIDIQISRHLYCEIKPLAKSGNYLCVIMKDSNATSTQLCSFKRLIIRTAISTFKNISDIKIDFPDIPGFYSLVNLIRIGWRYDP